MKTRHSFQKLLSALLVLTMLLGTLVLVPMTVGAAASTLPDSTPWDGSTRTQPEGAGTKDSPWKIASGANLAWVSYNAIAQISNRKTDDVPVLYMELTANVDLNSKSFTPIALRRQTLEKDDNGTPDDKDDDKPLYNYAAVVFDGKGGNIKGLNAISATSTGLFSYVGNGSSFKNINMVGANVSATGNEGVGALLGECVGYLEVYNCHLDATSSVKGVKAVGGLIGYVNPGKLACPTGTMKLSYCTNAGTVECSPITGNSPYAGGVIGRIKTDVDTTISYCYNSGSVLVNKNVVGNACVGGIIGTFNEANKPATKDYAAGDTITVEHCVNEGSIVLNAGDGSAVASTSKTYNWLGGLVGHFNMGAPADDQPNPYHTYVVDHCFDYSGKAVNLSSGAGVHQNAICYVNGNHADWQQYKNFKSVYGIKHASTSAAVSLHPATSYTAAVEMDSGVAETLDAEINVNFTKTTPAAEIAKIKAAIASLEEAVVGGAAIDDGKPRDYSWYTPDGGTKEAPYQIPNAAAWVGLVELSLDMNNDKSGQTDAVNFDGKYFELTGDIDLEGYVLYAVGGKGTIHLDGKNHTISNAELPTALFQELGRHSSVSNIVFDNIDVDADGNAAILALEAKAGVSCYNLHIKDTCSVVAGGNAAGLITTLIDNSDVNEEEDYINFQFCVNEADITGASTVAGIVANLQGSYCYNFDFCVNKGDILATMPNGSNVVGGIFGNFNRRSDAYVNYGTITNCYNTGTIGGLADAGQYLFIGGVFGCLRAGTGSDVTMINCLDYSARTQAAEDASKHLIGGVFGNADNTQLVKLISYCHAANSPENEVLYAGVFRWTNSTTTDAVDCSLVESLTEEVINYKGEASSIQAEMAAIDAAIAALELNEISFGYDEEDPSQPSDPTPGTPDPEQPKPEDPKPEDNKKEDDTTTKAPDTTAAPSGGCGSSVTATFAVVAMTALCGMAIVGKKKED